MIPIKYNVRSLAVRRTTTLATALGIALVVFVLASSQMLAEGMRKTLGASGNPENAIVMRQGSDDEMSSVVEESSVSLVLAAPGVKQDEHARPFGVSEVVVVAAMEKVGGEGMTNVRIRGVGDDPMKFRPEVHLVAGRPPQPGSDEVMIGARMRGRIKGLDLDQSFDLKKNRPVKIVGVFEAQGSAYESEVWVDREILRQAYNRTGAVSSVRVRLDSPSKFDAFRAGVENDKRLGLMAQREPAYYERQSEGISKFVSILGSIVSVFFAMGAMIGAMITMYAAVANRQREIGTLRALGFSRSSVLASFVFESVVLAAAGGVVGAVASIAMGAVRFSMLNPASWSEVVFSFDPTPGTLFWSIVFACGMGLFGGLLPAMRAARTSPLQAIRG